MTNQNAIDVLIQAAIDGQISKSERKQLDNHLDQNPEVFAEYSEMLRQADLLRASIPIPSPEHLLNLRAKAERSAPLKQPMRMAASAALFAVGIALGNFFPVSSFSASSSTSNFAKHAHAAHSLYVTEVLHPVEVAASERDHLQTWLSNRLGAAIIAPKLGDTGFTLIGGRLLPTGNQATALFMYENTNGDRISLLATHGQNDTKQSFRFHEAKDYLTISWRDGPWQYSLVGSLDRDPMGKIAKNIHGQLI